MDRQFDLVPFKGAADAVNALLMMGDTPGRLMASALISAKEPV